MLGVKHYVKHYSQLSKPEFLWLLTLPGEHPQIPGASAPPSSQLVWVGSSGWYFPSFPGESSGWCGLRITAVREFFSFLVFPLHPPTHNNTQEGELSI